MYDPVVPFLSVVAGLKLTRCTVSLSQDVVAGKAEGEEDRREYEGIIVI